MSRMMHLIAVVMLSLAPLVVSGPPHAAPLDCVPNSGCPEGMGPPDCCEPPPCEFYQALRMAKARYEITISLHLAYAAGDDLVGGQVDRNYSGQSFMEMDKLLDQVSPCPQGRLRPEEPPLLTVDDENECEIRYLEDFDNQLGEISLDDYLANEKSCDEQLNANYARVEKQQEICLALRARTSPRTVAERVGHDLEADDREFWELESQLVHYKTVCTVSDEADEARQAALLGTGALKKAPPKKQKPKKKNKRGGKKQTRGTGR